MLSGVRPAFRAIPRSVVPESAELDEAGWAEVERIVEHALALRPPAIRRQLGTLIRLLDWLPVLRYGRRLTALDDIRRARFLGAVQDARSCSCAADSGACGR